MSRPLISAEDVRAARRRRETRLAIPADAIVTPLARDEAARHGIDLVTEGGSTAAKARAGGSGRPASSPAPSGSVDIPTPSARPHVPTCDDRGDPVEQVVARVLARVPDADPAQVREIARRVLAKGDR